MTGATTPVWESNTTCGFLRRAPAEVLAEIVRGKATKRCTAVDEVWLLVDGYQSSDRPSELMLPFGGAAEFQAAKKCLAS